MKREPAMSQRAMSSFCWLPPESELAGAWQEDHFTFICVPSLADSAASREGCKNIFHAEDGEVRQRDVPEAGQLEAQAGTLAVLGEEGDALADGIGGGFNIRGRVVEKDFARVAFLDAEEGAGDFGAARTDKAGHADDFAAANFKRDIGDAFVGGKIFYLTRGLRRRWRPWAGKIRSVRGQP